MVMKWRDTGDSGNAKGELEDVAFDGDDFNFTLNNGNEADGLIPNLLKRKPTFIFLIGGVAVLIALLVLVFSGSGDKEDAAQVSVLESKIISLENRIVALEGAGRKKSGSGKQDKEIARLDQRLQRLEAFIAKRMNAMGKALADLKKVLAAPSPPKKAAAKKATAKKAAAKKATAKKAAAKKISGASSQDKEALYHEVRPGENLYRIGLRYGLKVDELLRLNNLEPETTIHVGQKLKVRPGSQ